MVKLPERKILIEDSTLREGEQTPGVAFSEVQKRTILEKLAEANVEYAEVGIPIMGSTEFKTIKALSEQPNLPKLIGWNRGVKSDLDRTFEAGLDSLHIGLPSSDIHIKNKFKKDYEWVIDTAISLVEYAKSQGAKFISVSAEDMGRANIEFLKKYAKALEQAGATRMRLSDTVGCLTPARTNYIVSTLKQEVTNLKFQLHMHNDLGLALANVLAGLDAGAEQVQVTINGLGDRAGIVSLHQAATAIKLFTEYSTSVKLSDVYNLSKIVEGFTGLGISHNEPVVGELVFSHESGIHVDGILKSKDSFESYPPELVGRSHSFVIGKHTGSHAIQYVLAEQGYEITREDAQRLLPFIREYSTMLSSSIEPEVLALLARYLVPEKNHVNA
jgi:homocitrate synthase NifV